ncbi:arsR family transcriptional regulator [Mycobacterium xenopi 3993]|nr:arsR family transcriptional regulator [Mycobacterium xenopi 3993]
MSPCPPCGGRLTGLPPSAWSATASRAATGSSRPTPTIRRRPADSAGDDVLRAGRGDRRGIRYRRRRRSGHLRLVGGPLRRSARPPPNDIDVLVIGTVSELALYAAADKAQNRIGIGVNPVRCTPQQWADPGDWALITEIQHRPYTTVYRSGDLAA